jgi:thiamine-phosphate pyrophosphorylase
LVKHLRHDLAACMRQLPGQQLLSARNTPSDVGTSIFTASEQSRADASDVCIAATKRLPEALRTLEEYGKTVDSRFGAGIEALRYRAYDLEQRIELRGDRSARFAKVRLYVLIAQSCCSRDWLETAQLAIAGGADCIQLREKDLDGGELLSRARRLGELCRKHGVLFIVNDRPDIALLADADGVHVGQTDLPVREARRVLGPDRLIGISTHDDDQFRSALTSGADYIAIGPMFPSPTKPQDHVPGPELLARAVRQTDIPIVPIGGISPENLDILKQAGARRVCACSAVTSVQDVSEAARSLMLPASNAS